VSEASEEREDRVEVRPGLVMIRRRTLKEDGRYLIYYDFVRPDSAQEPQGAPDGS